MVWDYVHAAFSDNVESLFPSCDGEIDMWRIDHFYEFYREIVKKFFTECAD